MPKRLIRPFVLSAFSAAVLGSTFALAAPAAPATWCPAGYRPAAAENEGAADDSELHRLGRAAMARERAAELSGLCVREKHPEAYAEFAAGRGQMHAIENAPLAAPPAGAMSAALAERSALVAAAVSVPGAGGSWTPYGKGPLIGNDARFGSVNGQGLVKLNGRVDSLDFDPVAGRLFASLGSGGVWVSENMGKSWRSIGDSLPTQIVGAVAWSPAFGGTVVAVTGEPIMAGYTRIGLGAYYSRDLGRTWNKSSGVPEGNLGFQVAVDPSKPNVVYVATNKGLFRSENAGATFSNVRLPTGSCAGKTDNQKCVLANIVTDVVVQTPDSFGHTGGRVLAVVGYRSSDRAFPQDDKVIESEGNGLYVSDTGKPGSFTKLEANGFAPKERIGKTELGVAVGPKQNHDFVYAVVQDAVIFNGGFPSIDAPEDLWPGQGTFNTVLNGIYVSPDYGKTWTQMADWKDIAEDPTTGSALIGTAQLQYNYAPGAQAWYNQFIQVDPTRQTADGVPTRIVFGLEEVWQNNATTEAANGKSGFHVIGRYYADRTCLFFDIGSTNCPTGRPPVALTTTHPDQHDAYLIPDGKGGVTLLVGNDGGVYAQKAISGEEFDNTKWGSGANDGFHTLLPYHAQMAKDGTVWFGLQDNGSGKIEPGSERIVMTYGGDGFWVAVDPDNSNYAWSEVTGGNMRVTTDGGVTWRTSGPVEFTVPGSAHFANPFVMDPLDADHLLTAGNDVFETADGPNTCPVSIDTGANQQIVCTWAKVFDLGSAQHPGSDQNLATSVALGETLNMMSAVALRGDAAYVGYCGPCGLLNTTKVFQSGIATNVGGTEPPRRTTSDGWHIAPAAGLPHRMVTGIAIDPKDPRTVYVTLGGYEHREWRPPGSFGDKNDAIGKGHVFKSIDAGASFDDISGALPDTPALSIALRGSQVVVGTKIGAFISSDASGSRWALLGSGLPAVQVMSLQVAPQDPNLLVAATFGRGVYTYQFPKTSVLGSRKTTSKPKPKDLPATGVGNTAGGALAVSLAAALASAIHRRRRSI